MSSPTKCFAKAKTELSKKDYAAFVLPVMKGARALIKSNGLGHGEAATKAVDDRMAAVRALIAKITGTQEAAEPDHPAGKLTNYLLTKIAAGAMPKDNPALKKLVESFTGTPITSEGMKAAQEALEAAIVRYSRMVVARNEGQKATFDSLTRLYESQPLLNVRTSTSIENQAYSTPAPLAYVASALAGITSKTKTLEPTAGNGMLLIAANPKTAVVNELNVERATALRAQEFDVTQHDAGVMPLGDPGSVDAVITNPPFGPIKNDKGESIKVKIDGYTIGQIDHLIAARALPAMKDDGSATLIIGANKVTGEQSNNDLIFFNWLYSNYNVTSHFEVDGDLYLRQGAGWPVRVITIQGRVKSGATAPQPSTISRANTWSEVYERFQQGLDAQRPAAERGASPVGDRPGKPADAKPVSEPVDGQARRPDSGRPASGAQSDGNVSGERAGAVDDRRAVLFERVGERAGAERPDGATAGASDDGRKPESGQRAKPAGNSGAAGLKAAETQFQTGYVARSARKDDGVLIPVNMAAPTQDALNRLEDEVGDIDEFARAELGYESVEALHDAFMGLQVDSVASAIHQIKSGKGVIIADQTGIGKGRQAAAIIRWAAKNGHIPVFVTVKPSLFTDMFGDLRDIGSDDISPMILNLDASIKGEGDSKLFANKPTKHKAALDEMVATGALPLGSNALFMTYSQINVANTQRKAVLALADKAVFILDESHNAGGDSSTGAYIRDVLGVAKGVTYLSATYAKRPDNMPVYFKTDIGDAVADDATLMGAMEAGGLPLQTVVANNLVKAGQMFRRERSYDGVSIESRADTAHRDEHVKMSDETTLALRAIVDADRTFHESYVKSLQKELKAEGQRVIDGAGNQAQASVDHTQFTSVVHNFVRQMLLGLKAQEAADDAIRSIKRGEKPLIALDNTMGAFLESFVDGNDIKQGDSLVSFDYRTVLSRALERSRYIIRQDAQGNKTKEHIPIGKLDPLSYEAYTKAQKVIDGLKIDIPVSPIDWIRSEITKAGYSVAEVTGRNLSVDYSDPKSPKLAQIDPLEQKDKVRTTRRFNGGTNDDPVLKDQRLDALILNVSGSTGISLHASEKFTDQRKRHMIVAQAAQDINIFMQMLGRVHRTGQVELPKYTLLSADLPAEIRPTALLSGKMKSLNANTSSNTESATSVKAADMLNKYGDQIVGQYLADNKELAEALHIDPPTSTGEGSDDIARRATGRLALMPVAVQAQFYAEVEEQYQALIEYLNKTNQNDLEPRTFDFDAKETKSETLFEGKNKASPFGEDATYGEYSVKAQGRAMTPAEIKTLINEHLGGMTPEQHGVELQRRLSAAFFDYEAKIKGDDALKVEAQKEEIRAVRSKGAQFIRGHAIGTKFKVEINDEAYNAIVTNLRSTHKATGNPFSMSKFQVTIAVNGSLRSLTVPATQFEKLVTGRADGYGSSLEQLFKTGPVDERETAKIVTGNLLGAYGEMQGARGSIIAFTKADGTTDQGILLPKRFEFATNVRQDYRLKTPADVFAFLTQSQNENIERFGINARDQTVRVLPNTGDGITIQVPKSKAKGGKYFLDKKLLEHTGDFVSSGNFMRAEVFGFTRVKSALEVLMKKQALYALPSMAEEARTIVGDVKPPNDKPPGGGVNLSVATGEKAVDNGGYGAATQSHTDLSDQLSERLGATGGVFYAVASSDGAAEGGSSTGANGRGGAALSPASRGRAAVATVAKRLFGSEVVFVKFDGRPTFNGAMSEAMPGVVFINVESQRPLMAVLGHELLHQLRQSDESLYKTLNRRLGDLLKNEGRYLAEMERRYAGIGRDLAGVRVGEELHADVVGDFFMDTKFWSDLAKDQPGLFKRVANSVVKFLDDVFSKVTQVRPFGTDQYLTDIGKARAAVVDAMRQFSGAQVGAMTTQSDGINLSVPDDALKGGNVSTPASGRSLGEALTAGLNNVRDVKLPAGYMVADLMDSAGKLSWWHKTVGSQYNLAQRSTEFKRVFDGVQNFLNDASFYANTAADLAPKILPKLDGLKDLGKSPISAEDTKAIAAPIFEGTLSWARDAKGKPVQVDALLAEAEAMTSEQKGRELFKAGHLSEQVLKMWRGLPIEQFEKMVGGKYERDMLKAGVVWTPAELKSQFKATGELQEDGSWSGQIGLYNEFRAATDKSLANLAISEMVNYAGKDADAARARLLDMTDHDAAAIVLRDHLFSLADANPERADALNATGNKVVEIADHATDMQERGYAPLSRFGAYTLEATLATGERYFSLFETSAKRSKMSRMLAGSGATDIKAGTMSQEDYKLLSGVSPETVALFGEMLGLDQTGDAAKDKAFAEYIKRGTSNRSAMKRLLKRQGIAGFSEDAGRVLAGFVYSNGRKTSSNLHMAEVTQAVSDMDKLGGEIKDAAVQLRDYVQNPQEEAATLRAILFAQYLGGSVASAMVNATQPFTVTLPYLSQFGGIGKAAKQMRDAVKSAASKVTGDAALDAVIKKAEDFGTLSPQEVHQLMAQAQGSAVLKSGDGTAAGDLAAKAQNARHKLALVWGKVFGVAEQFNRRVTFIAAYRTAVEQGIADPAAFATKAVNETQFISNKGNKPKWARGAIGATLFTFKSYSVQYLELMQRMAMAGEPGSEERRAGQRAVLLAMAVLFMMSGADGLPFMEDVQDVIDAAMQRMGHNFSSKQKLKEFLTAQLGKGGADFIQSGVSGLPGAPIDVSGRMGMGNLIPGSGLLQKKADHTRDLLELAGPAGDLAKRAGTAVGQLTSGDVGGAIKTVSTKAAQNFVQGIDMASTGMYKDARGYKVTDATLGEAAMKAIGFQPRAVKEIQDAAMQVQRAKSQYILASSEIRAKWAKGIFDNDAAQVAEARDDMASWNEKNPTQRISANMPVILSRVREMRKSKQQRVADTAPKAIRNQVRQQIAEELK